MAILKVLFNSCQIFISKVLSKAFKHSSIGVASKAVVEIYHRRQSCLRISQWSRVIGCHPIQFTVYDITAAA